MTRRREQADRQARDEASGRFVADRKLSMLTTGDQACFDPCYHVWRLSKGLDILKAWHVCFGNRKTANQWKRPVDNVMRCKPACPCHEWESYSPGRGGGRLDR